MSATTAGEVIDSDDDIWVLRSDLGDKRVQPIGVSFSAQKINRRRAAVLVAKFAERLEQQMDRCAVRKSAVKNDDLRRLPCEGRGSQPAALAVALIMSISR